jgi:hypothetical protein
VSKFSKLVNIILNNLTELIFFSWFETQSAKFQKKWHNCLFLNTNKTAYLLGSHMMYHVHLLSVDVSRCFIGTLGIVHFKNIKIFNILLQGSQSKLPTVIVPSKNL